MITLISLIHSRSGAAGKRLETTLQERFPKIDHEIHDRNGSFFQRLCQPNRDGKQEICIVLAETGARLEKMMGLKKILEGRRLVLILPGNQKKLLSMGQRLLPRYVNCGTDNYEELVSVLTKMINVLDAGGTKKASGDGDGGGDGKSVPLGVAARG